MGVLMQSILIGPSALRLVDKALGVSTEHLVDILRAVAAEYGVLHVAYISLSLKKSSDASVLSAVVTYAKLWQVRYFLKNYFAIDPCIAMGRTVAHPFDWASLPRKNPAVVEFLADSVRHNVGSQGVSIPVRKLKHSRSLVSYSSDLPSLEWETFKLLNIIKLQHLAVLIDAAAHANLKPSKPEIQLSPREEQCLIWAARGKTHQEIADILNVSVASARTHLDTARHKLNCINLTHAVGIAVATGVIPAAALRESA
jgi:DNA-binding CsgD family transcriptional regulator